MTCLLLATLCFCYVFAMFLLCLSCLLCLAYNYSSKKNKRCLRACLVCAHGEFVLRLASFFCLVLLFACLSFFKYVSWCCCDVFL